MVGGATKPVCGATLIVAAALAICSGASGDQRGESTNWAGYAAMGVHFKAVRGSWVEPAANCIGRSSESTGAAFWVGLGGNAKSSNKVEQIGTDSDCDPDGSGDYYAWYELWPARTIVISLDIESGDRISAAVIVDGSAVTLRLRDQTDGERFSKTVKSTSPDLSSAEWIAEAPTALLRRGSQVVALTDFGTIRFAQASATSTRGHTGSISDPHWRASAIDLESEVASSRNPLARFADQAVASHGFPTALGSGGRSFSITWKRGATPPHVSSVPNGSA